MKYINRSNVVEPPVAIGPTSVTKLGTYFWYQVAIMRNPAGLVYTKTIDKPGHKNSISNEPNFVRWEPANQGVL